MEASSFISLIRGFHVAPYPEDCSELWEGFDRSHSWKRLCVRKPFTNAYCSIGRKCLLSASCLPGGLTYVIWFLSSPHCYYGVSSVKWGYDDSWRTLLQVTQLVSDNTHLSSLVCRIRHATVHSPTSHRSKYLFCHLQIAWLEQVNEPLWNTAALSQKQGDQKSSLRRWRWGLNEPTQIKLRAQCLTD